MAEVLTTDAEDLKKAAAHLARGKPVAVPTETVYGLAAPVFDETAIEAVYRIKGRPSRNPLIVHVADPEDLERVVSRPPDWAERLIDQYWPGPLTLILRKREAIPDAVTAGRNTVAVRCPDHAAMRTLIRLVGSPLAAPSANPYTHLSPTRAEHVLRMLGDRIDYIVDGGPCREGLESTILARIENRFHLLRTGSVTCEDLEQTLNQPVQRGKEVLATGTGALAPGQHKRHYQPRTPLRVLASVDLLQFSVKEDDARIFLRDGDVSRTGNDFALSRSGSVPEIARNLYARLHEVDTLGFARILVERPLAEGGQADAVLERLERASAGS
ncbi:MAG: L-threonylcarbamoyladenylate synthase [Opitutales bacterium]